MTAAQAKTKRALEATISRAAGFECELTVRGLRDFTISADGCKDWTKLLSWLSSAAGYKIESHTMDYDNETDFSCLFFTVA